MAWIKSMGGTEPINPVIISQNTINYPCDATLASGTDSMYFTSPNQPIIYDVDLTNFNTLKVLTKGAYGGGAWFTLWVDNTVVVNGQYGSMAYELFSGDVSAFTGKHIIKLNYSVNLRCDISSMILS